MAYGAATVGMIALNAVTWSAPKGAIVNAGQWAKNPILYEIGSLTLPRSTYVKYALLNPVERGAALLAEYGGGLKGFLSLYKNEARAAGFSDWLATLAQGPTTGGLLGVLGLNWFIEEECE